MHKIKQLPEDFYVRERLNLRFDKEGRYVYFLLRKKNLGTIEAINKLAKWLDIPGKSFGVAGLKDKRAITEQYISVYGVSEKRLENVRIENILIKVLGRGNERIKTGDLDGNEFTIVIRDLVKERKLKCNKIINYFDEQRFGSNNANVGRSLVKGNFVEACGLLGLDKRNAVNSLRSVDKRTLRFYVHSYQSFLFNKAAKDILKHDKKNIDLPIIGFLTNFKSGKIKDIYGRIMIKEHITKADFLIKALKEISSEGSSRTLFVRVSDFRYKWLDDELNIGKKKVILNFSLPKGSYGTLVVRSLFSNAHKS